MNKFLEKLQNRENLNFEESKDAFDLLMEGKASDQEIFEFLTLLSAKGEVSDEIAGGVHVLRKKSNISCSDAFPSINVSKAFMLSSKLKSSLFFNFSTKFFIFL